MSVIKEPVVSVLLDSDWASGSLVEDVRRGFAAHPRALPTLPAEPSTAPSLVGDGADACVRAGRALNSKGFHQVGRSVHW